MHSALAMLASSSGVSSERSAFMNLVRNEIDRLNDEIGARGSLTLMFQRGNIKARTASLELTVAWLVRCPNSCRAAAGACDKHSQGIPVALHAVELGCLHMPGRRQDTGMTASQEWSFLEECGLSAEVVS